MARFIRIRDNYNPITLQGDSEKIINTEFIIQVTDWNMMKNKVRAGVRSRIQLSTGEYIDTVESFESILGKLESKET